MPPTPPHAALRIVRFALLDALGALMGDYQDSTGAARMYWERPEINDAAGEPITRPLVVFFSQDDGGQGEPSVGALDWSGIITVKAIADLLPDAETLLETVAPGMETITAPTGYSIQTRWLRPLRIPPADGVWQLGAQWRVHLSSTG